MAILGVTPEKVVSLDRVMRDLLEDSVPVAVEVPRLIRLGHYTGASKRLPLRITSCVTPFKNPVQRDMDIRLAQHCGTGKQFQL